MRSDAPKRTAMAETDCPASASFVNATTWSAGCIGTRMTFLGEREFGRLDVPGLDQAGHGVVGIEHVVVDQRLHGLEAAPAGDHGEALDAVFVGLVRPDHQVLQQAEGGDGGLELGIGPGVGRGSCGRSGGRARAGSAGFPG